MELFWILRCFDQRYLIVKSITTIMFNNNPSISPFMKTFCWFTSLDSYSIHDAGRGVQMSAIVGAYAKMSYDKLRAPPHVYACKYLGTKPSIHKTPILSGHHDCRAYWRDGNSNELLSTWRRPESVWKMSYGYFWRMKSRHGANPE